MYKVLWLLKRKDGISLEQFREHYENSHAVLAQKYFGDLLIEYKRNYKTETWGGGVPTDEGGSFGPIDWKYDCIAEWVMPDEAAFNRINEVFQHPVIGKEFYDDEEHFLDREATMLFKCSVGDTGTGDGHARAAIMGSAAGA
ncbi:MAG: EthD domain-containing protein [Novosphingobium sp.]